MGDRNPKSIHKQQSQKQVRHTKETRQKQDEIRNKQQVSPDKKR